MGNLINISGRSNLIPFESLEMALAHIFDSEPNLKTSSVVHKLGVGSGIQIGSRDSMDITLGDYLDEVKLATVQLRKKSKIHYKVLYLWYSANEHFLKSDFGTHLGVEGFHEVRLEGLQYLSEILGESLLETKLDDGRPQNQGDAESQFMSGDRIVIVGGSPHLIGDIAYFDKYLTPPRILCNWIKNGERIPYEINIEYILPVD